MRLILTRLLAICLLAAFVPAVAHAQAPAAGGNEILKRRTAQFPAQKKAAEAIAKQDREKLRTEGKALWAEQSGPAGVYCEVSDAINLGSGTYVLDKASHTTRGVEVACSNGPGYVLLQADSDKPEAIDCLSLGQSNLACVLPGNKAPAKTLQPLLTKAQSDCIVADARFLAETATSAQYELKCASGLGEILIVGRPQTATSTIRAVNCIILKTPGGAFPCKLTNEAANAGFVNALASKSTTPCTVTKQRFAMAMKDGTTYYEFACSQGPGQLVQADARGQYLRTLTCAQAAAMNEPCTLTAGAPGKPTADQFTAQAKAASIDCDVDKFFIFPPKPGMTGAVELACKNGTAGVMITDQAGKAQLFNCGRSTAEGYACSLSPKEKGYADLTAQLKVEGRDNCNVNNSTPLVSATAAYIEVSCANGDPGFMFMYPKTSNTPSIIYSCARATGIAGGCKLPANKKS